MTDKPRLSIDIYKQYVTNDKTVLWPDDPGEKALLARALFGQELIAEFDYWVRHSIDFLNNSKPQEPFHRHNQAYQEDVYFRGNLQTLDPKQKQVVRDLVRTTIRGLLFSFLVTLDQSSFGKYKLLLSPSKATNDTDISLFTELPDELHDELNDWIISFSEFSGEILELVQKPNGWWQFQPIEFFKS